MFSNSKRSTRAWLLSLEPDAWRLVSPEADEASFVRNEFPPNALPDQATLIQEAMHARGRRGAPLAIGLSANFCLAATVDVPAPTMLRKRQAMRFHLESWIPWSAEEFVADFAAHKNAALMAAVKIEPLKSLLDGLEDRDLVPTVVAPAALLALDRHLTSQKAPLNHALIWKHDEQAECFVIRDGQPLVWRHMEGEAIDDLTHLCSLDVLEQAAQMPWFARGVDSTQWARLAASGIEVAAPAEELTWDDALQGSIDAIAAGQREPLIDLRRDELAGRRPVQAVAPQLRRFKIAAVLAGLSACGALWMRGDQYAAGAADVRRQLTEVFEETFPKQPPPEQILSAVRKAHALLQGTRGLVKELPDASNSDQIFQQVLTALPTDLRYRVPEIRIEGNSVYLGGEVRSNADADRIAAALRSAGFEVDPPRTQRLAEQGFAVRLAAQIVSDAKKAVQ